MLHVVRVLGLVNASTYPNAPFHVLFRHSSYWSFASLRWQALSSQPSPFCLHGAQPTSKLGCGAAKCCTKRTVSNILKCHQMGGLKTAGTRTQQNGCIGTVCGILKGEPLRSKTCHVQKRWFWDFQNTPVAFDRDYRFFK